MKNSKDIIDQVKKESKDGDNPFPKTREEWFKEYEKRITFASEAFRDLAEVDFNTGFMAADEQAKFILGAEITRLRSELDKANEWIRVNERKPEIKEENESDLVLCMGFKSNRPDMIEYELMRWVKLEKPDTRDRSGSPIEFGWSKRWWDTNPDHYQIHFWRSLPSEFEIYKLLGL